MRSAQSVNNTSGTCLYIHLDPEHSANPVQLVENWSNRLCRKSWVQSKLDQEPGSCSALARIFKSKGSDQHNKPF